MILFPAIDLYEGHVVRLHRGDYGSLTDYGDDPVAQALAFAKAGCSWLHVIDLEGARAGEPRHLHLLPALVETGLSIQYGGGLRSGDALVAALRAGATRVMAGSLLVKNFDIASRLFERWGETIVAVVDVKEGKIAFGGWLEESDQKPEAFVDRLQKAGARHFLVTSVERDGTGLGPDLALYQSLLAAYPGIAVIAAGGIGSIDDLIALHRAGLTGAVTGRALYEGIFDIAKALEELRKPC